MRRSRSLRWGAPLCAAAAGWAAPSASGAEVLPDLAPEPVTRYAFDGKTIGGRSLFRFTAGILNRGAGDAVLVGTRASVAEGVMSVTQRIAQSDGPALDVPTAGQMRFETGDGHTHWHTLRFATYALEQLGVDGTPTGLAGTAVKTGFCLRDDKPHVEGPVPPARRYVDNCGNDSVTSLVTGIQAGFADVYEAEAANQWVDVTGLPAGRYRLTIAVDPDNLVRESDEANNVYTWELTLPKVTHTLARQHSTVKRLRVAADGRAKVIAYATLSHRSMVQATIFRMRGIRPVKVREMKPRRHAHGAARIVWDMRDASGRLARPGLYKAKLVARTPRGASEPEYMTFVVTRARGR